MGNTARRTIKGVRCILCVYLPPPRFFVIPAHLCHSRASGNPVGRMGFSPCGLPPPHTRPRNRPHHRRLPNRSHVTCATCFHTQNLPGPFSLRRLFSRFPEHPSPPSAIFLSLRDAANLFDLFQSSLCVLGFSVATKSVRMRENPWLKFT